MPSKKSLLHQFGSFVWGLLTSSSSTSASQKPNHFMAPYYLTQPSATRQNPNVSTSIFSSYPPLPPPNYDRFQPSASNAAILPLRPALAQNNQPETVSYPRSAPPPPPLRYTTNTRTFTSPTQTTLSRPASNAGYAKKEIQNFLQQPQVPPQTPNQLSNMSSPTQEQRFIKEFQKAQEAQRQYYSAVKTVEESFSAVHQFRLCLLEQKNLLSHASPISYSSHNVTEIEHIKNNIKLHLLQHRGTAFIDNLNTHDEYKNLMAATTPNQMDEALHHMWKYTNRYKDNVLPVFYNEIKTKHPQADWRPIDELPLHAQIKKSNSWEQSENLWKDIDASQTKQRWDARMPMIRNDNMLNITNCRECLLKQQDIVNQLMQTSSTPHSSENLKDMKEAILEPLDDLLDSYSERELLRHNSHYSLIGDIRRGVENAHSLEELHTTVLPKLWEETTRQWHLEVDYYAKTIEKSPEDAKNWPRLEDFPNYNPSMIASTDASWNKAHEHGNALISQHVAQENQAPLSLVANEAAQTSHNSKPSAGIEKAGHSPIPPPASQSPSSGMSPL